jgi:dTDP-L-rhamnose 4-epimerase
MHILITGGAGFIGSHLADELLDAGYRVRALDRLVDQVHDGAGAPDYLDPAVELVVGDVRDPEALDAALQDVDAVVHLAARVGVGQSMYELADYQAVNAYGTAVLLEALMDRPLRKLLVASSMSIYGEGLYRAADGRVAEVGERGREQLERGEWEPGDDLQPVPTPEWKTPSLSSIYALGKYDQERMCLLFGRAYGIPTVALRFFNVYGPDQALSNPYTGVLAIFASRLLNDRPPLVFEDGSGESVSVREIAERLARVIGKEHLEPEITGKYRVGDIRHCFADIAQAGRTLGFAPEVSLDDGMAELAEWLEGQVAEDRAEHAAAELAARGLSL